MILLGAADWFNTWITPLWLLSLGVLLGFAGLLILWGLVFVVSRRAGRQVPVIVSEGPLAPIFYTFLILAVFGALGAFLVHDAGALIQSALRFPFTGTTTVTMVLPGVADDETVEPQVMEIDFRADELRTIQAKANESLLIVSEVQENGEPIFEMDIEADEVAEWDRGVLIANPFEREGMDRLLIHNGSENPAELTFTVYTAPLHPQVKSVYVTIGMTMAFFVIYFFLHWTFPKMSAVALATAKSELSSPLFSSLIMLGIFLLTLYLVLPAYTFGEDIKVLKDSGMVLIMVFAIFHAIWAGSSSVAEEIDGKTALTVLSKPIGRQQFILGKFFGISWSTAVLFVVLGAWLLLIVSYKPIYDARESAQTRPTWQVCHLEIVRTVPGLFLAFLESTIFVALSVAISTRLPILANLMICFVIYAFGHLTPLMVPASEGNLENVAFMARFLAMVLPVLDQFNIQAAISTGAAVSFRYLGVATIYCALYCSIAILLALVLFEDRDLA